MTHYRYKHKIDVTNDPQLDDRGKAIIGAAFAVAARAHEGQSRKKIDPSKMYISHPIMVYEIMRRLGEKDPVVLAAALLHDVIEHQPRFRENMETLHDELQTELQMRGISDIEPIVTRLSRLCLRVTNPEYWPGDGIKENYQHDRVKEMSLNAKKIKLVDQAASLICNLTMANNPDEFTPKQEIKFTEKAHTLAIALFQSVQSNPEELTLLKPWASFLGKVMLNVLPLLQSHDTQQKEEIRQNFDFDRVFDAEPYIDILPDRQSSVERVHMPKVTVEGVNGEQRQRQGLSWVEYDKAGEVVRYALWVDWHDTKGQTNTIQERMTENIRAMRRMITGGSNMLADQQQLIRTLPLLLPGRLEEIQSSDGKTIDGLERVFTLAPSLNAAAFAAVARQSRAIPSPSVKEALFITENGDRVARETGRIDRQRA